jgi:UDP:flavonoid glycosyltransferase YjiC (YdhE family)
MATIAMCWELGAGLGHIANLLPLAIELRRRGHRIEFIVSEVSAAEKGLPPQGFIYAQAPIWRKSTGLPMQISYAETLMGAGYLDGDGLSGLVKAWRRIYDWINPDLIIADYAPTAMLAARIDAIPTCMIGQGFLVPPKAAPIASFRTWETVDEGRLVASEMRVTSQINKVLAAFGATPLASLSHLFDVEDTFLITFPELDHYGARPAATYYGPCASFDATAIPEWPGGSGPKIFAYVKGDYTHIEPLLNGLSKRKEAILISLQGGSDSLLEKFTTGNVRISRDLFAWDAVLESTDIVACHAGPASATTALLAGKPVMLMPMNAEQYLFGTKVETTGAGLSVAPGATNWSFDDALDTIINSTSHSECAEAFSFLHRDFDLEISVARMATACELVLTNS